MSAVCVLETLALSNSIMHEIGNIKIKGSVNILYNDCFANWGRQEYCTDEIF